VRAALRPESISLELMMEAAMTYRAPVNMNRLRARWSHSIAW
jgi:hypothetical protein